MADWVIAGKMKGAVPEVGKKYEIRDERKGTFDGVILEVIDSFATVEVVDGKVHWASNERRIFDPNPETVSIRDTLVYLIEV